MFISKKELAELKKCERRMFSAEMDLRGLRYMAGNAEDTLRALMDYLCVEVVQARPARVLVVKKEKTSG